MTAKFNAWLFVSAIMIVPLTFFVAVSWYDNNKKQLPVLATGVNDHVSFSLLTQRGNIITNDSFRNKIIVADFFFTHCPNICSKMTKNLVIVQDALKSESVTINSFSIDPERDSVARLAQYATLYQVTGNWNLLTGQKEVIYRIARKSYLVDATEGDGGPDDFIHSDRFVLIDTKGRIRGFYKGTDLSEVGQLIKDVQKLRREKRKTD